jgi:hypothetical protein
MRTLSSHSGSADLNSMELQRGHFRRVQSNRGMIGGQFSRTLFI